MTRPVPRERKEVQGPGATCSLRDERWSIGGPLDRVEPLPTYVTRLLVGRWGPPRRLPRVRKCSVRARTARILPSRAFLPYFPQ